MNPEKIKEMFLLYEGIHRWKSISQQEAVERPENMVMEIDTIVAEINLEMEI